MNSLLLYAATMGSDADAALDGAGEWDLPALALDGQGTSVAPGTGSGSWTLPPLALDGVGTALAVGVGAWTLPALALTGAYVTPVTEAFLAALRTRLRGLAELGDLSNVYLTTSPPRAAWPFLVVNRLWELPFVNTSSSYYKETAVQFTVIGDDAEQVDTLGQAAYDALFPNAANPPIGFTDGTEMTRLPGMTHGPVADTAGMVGGDIVWRFHFDIVWLIGKG